MSLLKELIAFLGHGGYKDYAPPELSRIAAKSTRSFGKMGYCLTPISDEQ
jgi:hypothetical protein